MANPLLVGVLLLLAATFLAMLLALARYGEVPEDSPYAHGACGHCGGPLPSPGGECAECAADA